MYNNHFYNIPIWQPATYNHSFQELDYSRNMMHLCHKYMNFYVIGQLADGTQVEGIIDDMDDEHVTLLVPETVEADQLDENRQFGGYGSFGDYGYGGYGGFGRRRFRRFRRRRFPFNRFIYPFIFPFPFFF